MRRIHRAAIAADVYYWPEMQPIASQARRRYTTLAADACYWLPLPGERGERHREPSQVESPDAHPF
jgi:hypothetical protein